jgi:hypothetical protein
MKKSLFIILIFIILGSILPGSLATAQSEKSPHENPEKAAGVFDGISLLLTYSQIFYLASISDYEDAQAILDEFGEIEIPEEIRYIIERYNELSRQLFTTLDNLEILLDETANLIKVNQIDKARQNLDIAETQVKQARLLLDELLNATDILGERLGVFLNEESTDIQEANLRLLNSLEQIQQLLDKIQQLLDNLTEFRLNLTEQYITAMELQPTQLSLEVSPSSMYIGESVMVSGLLRSKDEPLASKSIQVLLDGNIVEDLVTRADGTYCGDIILPYEYVDSMTIFTRYEPHGEDAHVYQASQSQELEITTLYYNTELSIKAPATAYPGIPFDLSGEIITEGDNVPRIVRIFTSEIDLAEFEAVGVFNVTVSLPAEIDVGMHRITVMVEPWEKHTGMAESIEINVALMPVAIEMVTPGFIILPGVVELTGNVHYELGPLASAAVSFSINNKSITVPTSHDGSFTANLYLPLDISFMGQRDLIIDIESLEPWASSLQKEQRIMVINPVGILLVLLVALALAVFITRRWWRTVRKDVIDGVVIRPEITETPVAASPTKPTGVTGRIIAAYRAFLTLAERIYGIHPVPSMTLREFLESATKLLPGITRPLTSLTDMMERVLYSNQKPSRETAVTAEQLTVIIKEELGHEAS